MLVVAVGHCHDLPNALPPLTLFLNLDAAHESAEDTTNRGFKSPPLTPRSFRWRGLRVEMLENLPLKLSGEQVFSKFCACCQELYGFGNKKSCCGVWVDGI